jgi:alpha-L-fucosidase
MNVNDEGIFGSRPWKINGEGPSMTVKVEQTGFNESKQPDLGPADVRFTTKGKTMYAFVQGWPEKQVAIQSLGTASAQQPEKVMDVRMLGRNEALPFTQSATGLTVNLPGEKPPTADLGITLRINFA